VLGVLLVRLGLVSELGEGRDGSVLLLLTILMFGVLLVRLGLVLGKGGDLFLLLTILVLGVLLVGGLGLVSSLGECGCLSISLLVGLVLLMGSHGGVELLNGGLAIVSGNEVPVLSEQVRLLLGLLVEVSVDAVNSLGLLEETILVGVAVVHDGLSGPLVSALLLLLHPLGDGVVSDSDGLGGSEECNNGEFHLYLLNL